MVCFSDDYMKWSVKVYSKSKEVIKNISLYYLSLEKADYTTAVVWTHCVLTHYRTVGSARVRLIIR